MKKDWYKKYPNINSSHFYLENSGQYMRIPHPYMVSLKDDLDLEDRGPIGNPDRYHPIGYCLNIPDAIRYFPTKSVQVGIMFENKKGEKVWFHFPKD